MKKFLLILAIVLLALPTHSFAADSKAEKAELRAKFESRYPEIKKYKSIGKIGETSEGYLDVVKTSSDEIDALISAENDDRKSLYKIIAADQGTTVELVAEHAAIRNFEHTKPGEYLKSDGKWKQK